jgi:GT2 family glycosyltransferase
VRVTDLACADRLWALVYNEARPVRHIRRILLTKASPAVSPRPPGLAKLGQSSVKRPAASITVIIPSKDRPDLLGPCLSSLRDSLPADFEVLIADNGSERAETHSLYRSISGHSGMRILAFPGPFNFSSLCNRAAAAAHGQVLVFLNDDTIAVQPDWLVRLADWALRPECGAIGAKLHYPSGRVQHGGLVVGLGGYAAHIESGARSADPGYLDRLDVTHEVSAVTGACLAVEKAKFAAVNGFDAESFPVELGDVDLCLRLEALGWKTMFAADAMLIHRESATRGRARDREIRYAREHRLFAKRWQSRIHDDPFFHPALSLNSLRTRLDG